jgi:hypothetical protein
MANSYICSFVDPSSITCYYGATTISAAFPKENVLNYDFPLRATKSTVTTPATISMRFHIPSAANTPILGVLVRHTNFGYVDIKTNASSTGFGTGDVESVTGLTSIKDTRVNRYNAFWTYATNANSLLTLSSNQVYWQVNQSATTLCFNPTDYASIGSIYFINRVDRINYDYQLPFQVSRTTPIMKTDRVSGGAKVVTLGSPKVTISFPTALPTIATSDYGTGGEEQLYSFQDKDKHKGFLFWENRSNERLSRIYHVRQAAEFPVIYSSVDTVMDCSMDLEEIV